MKVVVISNMDTALAAFRTARQQGYITFIYNHADPQHTLSDHKFTYVGSDEELVEKINLLKQDPTVQEQVTRW
jgi:hypothetical protein